MTSRCGVMWCAIFLAHVGISSPAARAAKPDVAPGFTNRVLPLLGKTIVMAGAGIKGGLVIGETNANAEEPVTEPIKPQDVAVSFYRALDIDATKEYHTATGRPIQIVRGGQVIPDLLA